MAALPPPSITTSPTNCIFFNPHVDRYQTVYFRITNTAPKAIAFRIFTQSQITSIKPNNGVIQAKSLITIAITCSGYIVGQMPEIFTIEWANHCKSGQNVFKENGIRGFHNQSTEAVVMHAFSSNEKKITIQPAFAIVRPDGYMNVAITTEQMLPKKDDMLYIKSISSSKKLCQ
uniref:Major sperm protein n=1 Tax=Meloidogyne incognita TaxID=6306 RepID=A0A914M7Q5_MELIC